MAIREFTSPNPLNNKLDHILVGEAWDMANRVRTGNVQIESYKVPWCGSMRTGDMVDALEHGHLPSVALSEQWLSKVEGLIDAPTARNTIINDVTGSFPDVPAMLAGHPLAMRRKAKREDDQTPIALVVDTTSSGGIDANVVAKRGAVLMALARALSASRPVELYTCCGLGTANGNGMWTFFRIETAPLDLSRAAFLLGHPAASRGAMYGMMMQGRIDGKQSAGNWPYNNMNVVSETIMASVVARALPHVDHAICIPAVHVNDGALTRPLEWLKEMIVKYGHADLTEMEAA